MDPQSGAASAGTETTPVTKPRSPDKNYQSHAHNTPSGAFCGVARTNSARHHRWHRRRTVSVTLCDIVVWAAFTVATVVVLLGACAALWVFAP